MKTTILQSKKALRPLAYTIAALGFAIGSLDSVQAHPGAHQHPHSLLSESQEPQLGKEEMCALLSNTVYEVVQAAQKGQQIWPIVYETLGFAGLTHEQKEFMLFNIVNFSLVDWRPRSPEEVQMATWTSCLENLPSEYYKKEITQTSYHF